MNVIAKTLAVISFPLLCLSCSTGPTTKLQDSTSHLSPDERFSELFEKVQLSEIFSDSKTFVDSTPKTAAETILQKYRAERERADFDLQAFVTENFYLPPSISSDFKSDPSKNAAAHIESLWPILTREPDSVSDGSLIPLPHAYVVPGGRFREIYYWDSYFTMLGLQESNRWDLIENMVDNFSHLIDTMGFIPNGNRTYYQTRSQPPFYALMVKLLAEKKGPGTLTRYRPYLLKEYQFWMSGADTLSAANRSVRRVVMLPDGSTLNRYWDSSATPRPESYKEDVELVHGDNPETYRHIRAAAESGWDFSSRWFKDGNTLASIHTTDIIPVDLNALLYYLEQVLAEAYAENGDTLQAQTYRNLAQQRKEALLRYCWDPASEFFYDYDFVEQRQTRIRSLAAMYPLFFHMVDTDQARQVARHIERDFLQGGGVTTTLIHTGEQWDAPNGWAPLQWITIRGLRHYQHNQLADTIKNRWITLNTEVYQRTGKMVEKYNVYEPGLEGGGGEYPVQDGFGWTNGVLLKLLNEASQPTPSPTISTRRSD